MTGFLDSPHWCEPVGGLRPATSPATDGAGTGATEPAQAQRRKKVGGWRLVFPLCDLKGPEESLQASLAPSDFLRGYLLKRKLRTFFLSV